MHRMQQSPKRIPSKVIETVQLFQQHFIQGMWYGDNPLMQIPHMSHENIKKYSKIIKEHNIPNGSVDTFCRLSAQKRSDLKLFTPKQLDEVEALVRVMPVVEVSAKAFCEGENEMTMSDIITFKLSIKLQNMNEKEFPGFVHSQQYPNLKKQGWWIIISDQMKDRCIRAHRLVFKNPKQNEFRLAEQDEIDKEPLNEEHFEFRERFGQAGTFKFICTFMNDSYVGFDKEVPLQFDVVQDDPSRVIPDYDEED